MPSSSSPTSPESPIAVSRTLVIVPTYNEIENIERLVESLLEQKSLYTEFHVLVVDDNSADGTGDAVERMAQSRSRLHLLRREGKQGLGTAYIAGFRYALAEGYDNAATMDADFSHAPGYLPQFVESLVVTGSDLVIGSRYTPGGGVRNWGFHRKLLSATANVLAHGVAGLKPRDCTTGYRLYRTRLLERIDLDGITSDGYSCLMELLFVCQAAGAQIIESPIVFVDRAAGESKVSRAEMLKALGTLWRLLKRRLKGEGRSRRKRQGNQR